MMGVDNFPSLMMIRFFKFLDCIHSLWQYRRNRNTKSIGSLLVGAVGIGLLLSTRYFRQADFLIVHQPRNGYVGLSL